MKFQYDSWNRMRSITYPDNEEVMYQYDQGGNLFRITSVKGGEVDTTIVRPEILIDQIVYDKFGNRKSIHYGNEIVTTYAYDSLQRMVRLRSVRGDDNPMQDIIYEFDKVDNITQINDIADPTNRMGGRSTAYYHYDGLNRLSEATGYSDYGSFSLAMEYSSDGCLASKQQRATSMGSCQSCYMESNDTYVYGYGKSHAPKRIYNCENDNRYDLRWDANGNLGQLSAQMDDELKCRFLFWNEENRMHAVVDDDYFSYYSYDYTGERVLKLTGESQLMGEDGDQMSIYTVLDNPTLYASPYMVITPHGYTKHYYAGTNRLCAKIGGGGLDYTDSLYHQETIYADIQTSGEVPFDPGVSMVGNPSAEAPGGQDLHINQQYTAMRRNASDLFRSVVEEMQNRSLPENDNDNINIFSHECNEMGSVEQTIPNRLNLISEDAGRLIVWRYLDQAIRRYADDPDVAEAEIYYYHSDHLGGANWISDNAGDPVQYLQYMPFGEPLVNHKASEDDGYSERFTFTGKERDVETGYNYHGARYYDAGLLTGWLSVDPLADKYPSMSPYNYCAWNPVKLVDLDGREVLPTSAEAYQMILMTVPESARDYIQCNTDGYIDRDLINLYDCESSNFKDLKELVNNDCVIEVSVSSSYNWINSEGAMASTEMSYCNPTIEAELMRNFGIMAAPSESKGIYSISTGETGEMGITALPISSVGHQSTNGNIQITINSQLSPQGRAETFSHEFYGHAYLFATTIDANRAVHDYSQPGKDSNLELKNRIIRAQNETSSYSK